MSAETDTALDTPIRASSSQIPASTRRGTNTGRSTVINPPPTTNFALGFNDVFQQLDDQIRELDTTIDKLAFEITFLEEDAHKIEATISVDTAELKNTYEAQKKKNQDLRRVIKTLRQQIVDYGHADKSISQIDAIKSKEIKRLRNMLDNGSLTVDSCVRAHKSQKAEYEQSTKALDISENSLNFSRAEVAELEERLRLLEEKMNEEFGFNQRQKEEKAKNPDAPNEGEDVNKDETQSNLSEENEESGIDALTFLGLQRELRRLREVTKMKEEEFMRMDSAVETKLKRLEQLQRLKALEDRRKVVLEIEKAKLGELRKTAASMGIKLEDNSLFEDKNADERSEAFFDDMDDQFVFNAAQEYSGDSDDGMN
ncbi:hypothetical protein BLNAU_2314 [Blattamonas nauphoetae]|uniref:Uncharacterized protein n=1 Tax=Blattamonas nauphoetae TaxID=2049346 RepID=A0ABQ9YGJ4_9EUKA|nr:hypothetical protein BLNAU_2314 [Blattamonas nauphoetae]